MLFQRINRSSPEKIFIVANNAYTVALTDGQAVQWDFAATTPDGVGVTRPTARATNGGQAAAGVVAETIGVGGYGLVQVYGYHAAVRTRRLTGRADLATGNPLALNAAGSLFCLETFATASTVILVQPCGFALADNTKYTTTAIAAFIKAL